MRFLAADARVWGVTELYRTELRRHDPATRTRVVPSE